MSLTTTLNAALSGLTAAARGAGVVSANVANAMTDGYGRRELELASRGVGTDGGVRVVGERRIVDSGLLAERRNADAAVGDARARAGALARVEAAFGLPGEPGALLTRVATLDAALTEAASRPDSDLRLESVLRGAQDLATGIAATATAVQDARSEADAAIATEVERLNTGLSRVADLNRAILRELSAGRSANGLLDQRQALVDSLAEVVPLRSVDRANGQLTLYTDRGAVLLDSRPAQIGFIPASGPVVAGMTHANGALSGLTVNGIAVSTGANGALSGGRLGGLFAARDALLPAVQTGLDTLAANLVDRFAAADSDPAGEGLFVDFGPAAPDGLAQRLGINPAADPAQGGAAWRLRDGLAAPTAGLTGDSRTLAAMAGALAAPQALSGPGFGDAGRDFSGLLADLQSRHGRARDAAEADIAFTAARSTALTDALARDGVDTDAEMQKLLIVERAYAANARVLQAADEMLRTLLSIR